MTRISIDWRRLPIHFGILATFLCIPLWYRNNDSPVFLAPLYVSSFVIVIPMLISIVAWLVSGMPGFSVFSRDNRGAGWATALLSLVLWMYASGSWAFMGAARPHLATNVTMQFALVALFALVVACAGPSPRIIIAALVIGLVFNAAVAGTQAALQHSIGLTQLGEFGVSVGQPGVSVIQSGDLRWLRPYGLMPHPNILAGIMVPGLLALVDWLLSRHGGLRWLGYIVLVPCVWAFLLTFSRGSYVALAAGSVALLPLLWRTKRAQEGLGLTILVLLMIGAVFFLTYQPLLLARTQTILPAQASVEPEAIEVYSVTERAALAETAARAINDNLLLGVGAGNFPWRASYYLYDQGSAVRGNNVHNVMLSVWAELGLIGFVMFMAAIVLGIEAVLQQIRAQDENSTSKAVLLAGFIALTIVGLFDHYTYTLIQPQVLWWGILAAAIRPQRPIET